MATSGDGKKHYQAASVVLMSAVDNEVMRAIHQAFLVGWMERGARGEDGDSEEAFQKWWRGR